MQALVVVALLLCVLLLDLLHHAGLLVNPLILLQRKLWLTRAISGKLVGVVRSLVRVILLRESCSERGAHTFFDIKTALVKLILQSTTQIFAKTSRCNDGVHV